MKALRGWGNKIMLMEFPILRLALISSAIAVVGASAAAAGEPVSNPSLTKSWVFDAGAVFQNLDGGVGAGLNGEAGGIVSFSQIGLDDESVSPYFSARWRFAERWRLDFIYNSIDVDGNIGANSAIEFGRITIPVGYEVDSSLEVQNYSAYVGYSFVKDDQAEFGARLGLSVLDADANLRGEAFIGGASVVVGAERAGVWGPIPTIGIYGTYALSNNLALEGSLDGLALKYSDYEGHYLAASVMLTYWINDTFAIGAGYRYVDAKLERQGDVVKETIDIVYQGPIAKASVGF